MIVPDRRQVPFIVLFGLRNPIRSSIPRARFEVLRERSESGGREWSQHVGHGDPRATDESSIRVGPTMAAQFSARTQVRSAVGARARTGRIRHRARWSFWNSKWGRMKLLKGCRDSFFPGEIVMHVRVPSGDTSASFGLPGLAWSSRFTLSSTTFAVCSPTTKITNRFLMGCDFCYPRPPAFVVVPERGSGVSNVLVPSRPL